MMDLAEKNILNRRQGFADSDLPPGLLYSICRAFTMLFWLYLPRAEGKQKEKDHPFVSLPKKCYTVFT
ncbi:MAG: hypothetical protein HFI14_06730 [Lachnospiraceae bacterium]|nr:hypothetical protein [Lachnospiraceae bacterium]